MVTENAPMQVLTPSGNQSPLAKNNPISSLLSGQVGVFNIHTGLSVDATSPNTDLNDVFIAVGTGGTADGQPMVDFQKSTGQMIQSRFVKDYTVKGTVSDVAKIVELTGFVARCESDYGIKIEFRNQKSYNLNGFNQFTKTFDYTTGCCSDQCVGCGTGDGVELAVGLRDAINADPDQLVIAALFANVSTSTVGDPTTDGTATILIGSTAYQVALLAADTPTTAAAKIAAVINADTSGLYRAGSAAAVLSVYPKSAPAGATATNISVSNANGTGLTLTAAAGAYSTISDSVAFKAANPGVTPGLRITSNPTALSAYTGNINLGYDSARTTDIIVTPAYGFRCNGVINTTQNLQYAEGMGFDLNQIIYEAGGFNGQPGPYRTSAITGLERGNFTPRLSPTANFNVIGLMYDVESVAGNFQYKGSLETIIAIPCADTTTLTGLVAILDVLLPKFGPNTNDVSSMNCSNSRVGLLAPATDGIESLA